MSERGAGAAGPSFVELKQASALIFRVSIDWIADILKYDTSAPPAVAATTAPMPPLSGLRISGWGFLPMAWKV